MYEKKCDVLLNEGLFTNLCKEFIQYKRGMGQNFSRSYQYQLRYICRRLNNMNTNAPNLTREMIETLAAKRSIESQGTQTKRVRLLRQFALFMLSMGFEVYVCPKHSLPQNKYDFRPYLFSHEQIIAIIKVADELVPSCRSAHTQIRICKSTGQSKACMI